MVWDGMGGGLENTGGRYDPAMDSWTATSAMGAPSPRFNHTAVWTGGAMIVWGGMGGSGALDTGGVYRLTSLLSLSPTSQSFTASGGSGSVSVTAPGSCDWTASSHADWLSITSGGSGTGSGTVNYSPACRQTGWRRMRVPVHGRGCCGLGRRRSPSGKPDNDQYSGGATLPHQRHHH